MTTNAPPAYKNDFTCPSSVNLQERASRLYREYSKAKDNWLRNTLAPHLPPVLRVALTRGQEEWVEDIGKWIKDNRCCIAISREIPDPAGPALQSFNWTETLYIKGSPVGVFEVVPGDMNEDEYYWVLRERYANCGMIKDYEPTHQTPHS